MDMRHPRRRRWFVRRIRFQDNNGGQVTDTWLNVPLLPRRILAWRSQDRRWGQVRFTIGSAVTDVFVLIVVVAVGIYQEVSTGQWLWALFGCLIMLAALLMLSDRWRQRRQQQGRRASHR